MHSIYKKLIRVKADNEAPEETEVRLEKIKKPPTEQKTNLFSETNTIHFTESKYRHLSKNQTDINESELQNLFSE